LEKSFREVFRYEDESHNQNGSARWPARCFAESCYGSAAVRAANLAANLAANCSANYDHERDAAEQFNKQLKAREQD